MKLIIIGAHLRREDIEPLAEALPVTAGGVSEESESCIWLSAISVARDQLLGDRELLLRVTRMRGDLLQRATFIAVRYGFSARSAADAAAKCAQHVARWRGLLELHRGEAEMTLKMSASSSEPRPRRDGFSSGADYVKSLYDPARAEGIDAPFRDAVENVLRPLTSSMIWIHRDNSSIELAVLARRDCVDLVRQAGEALHAEFPRIPFRLSGPWPLEAFAAADRE